MERTEKCSLEETCEGIKKLPPRRLSKHLEAFLERTISYKNNVARLCREVYCNSENPEAILESLSKLADAGEYYCYQRRTTLDSMHKTAHINDNITKFPVPCRADFSTDIEITYNGEINTIRIVMPQLLPFKTKWNCYLPDKIRCALASFESEFKARNERKLRISPAYALFIHHYDDEHRAKGYYRDYDNMEYSCVLNALHSTQIFNDSAATFISTHMAVPDTKSFTEIVLTDVHRMVDVMQSVDLSLYC